MGVKFNYGKVHPFSMCITISYQIVLLKSGEVKKLCSVCEGKEEVLCISDVFLNKVYAHYLFEMWKSQVLRCDICFGNKLIRVERCQCEKRRNFLDSGQIVDGSQ